MFILKHSLPPSSTVSVCADRFWCDRPSHIADNLLPKVWTADHVECTDQAHYVGIQLRLGLARARLGSRDRLELGLGLA